MILKQKTKKTFLFKPALLNLVWFKYSYENAKDIFCNGPVAQ